MSDVGRVVNGFARQVAKRDEGRNTAFGRIILVVRNRVKVSMRPNVRDGVPMWATHDERERRQHGRRQPRHCHEQPPAAALTPHTTNGTTRTRLFATHCQIERESSLGPVRGGNGLALPEGRELARSSRAGEAVEVVRGTNDSEPVSEASGPRPTAAPLSALRE